ncbi:PIN domain-containing protein [Treponema sp. TIM-1]|uniref:PIN domain-containing protein n=1 Tax=Treponema sp. TIM-1 TaxID=2898417 RepID=UPI003980E087
MKVLIDTNVIIDVLEQREGFFRDSYRLIQLAGQERLEAFMSAGAVTDVYYIISRSLHDAQKVKEKIIGLTALISICDTTAGDITTALTFPIADFEDAVIAAIAKREKADYIVTQNETDFTHSPVPVISPTRFLRQFMGNEAENG